MQQVTLTEASKDLATWIDVVLQGEDITIIQNGTPVAKLTAIPSEKPRPKFGSAKGLISISDDFDEPLEDFVEYMQ